ncbi:MAG: hypothetical protein H6R22_1176 [Chromatiaceae bacterium]|nr:hypothetical protein [Chromatiaceae bacterium]
MSKSEDLQPPAAGAPKRWSGFSTTSAPEGALEVSIGPRSDLQPRHPGSADAGDSQAVGPRAPRGIGQQIAFAAALLFYLCAVLSLGALFVWIRDLGGDHPVIASLGASVVFFIGAGIVLHVIGRANLPDLGFRRSDAASGSVRNGRC